jgi:TPP-dependent pyruvate/acetoin dehydrogenase alpha subunit
MDKKTILKVHEIMLSIRKFEECALKLFEENKLRGIGSSEHRSGSRGRSHRRLPQR